MGTVPRTRSSARFGPRGGGAEDAAIAARGRRVVAAQHDRCLKMRQPGERRAPTRSMRWHCEKRPSPSGERRAGPARSRCHTRRRALAHDADVLELFPVRRHVEDDGAIADSDVAGDLVRYPLVAPHQVGAERLVVFERHHPVRLVLPRGALPEAGELLVPFRIGDLHRQLVGELPLPVFRKPGVGDGPCLARVLAGDDPDADPERGGVDRRRRLVLGHRLGVAHGERAELSGRRQSRVRRPGDEHARCECGVERRRQLHLGDPVVAPVQRHGSRAAEQLHDERRVLDQPGVPLVVGRRIVQRLEVVLEAARNHVEVDEDPLAPRGLAPSRDVHHVPAVSQRGRRERRRAGREHLQSRLPESIGHATPRTAGVGHPPERRKPLQKAGCPSRSVGTTPMSAAVAREQRAVFAMLFARHGAGTRHCAAPAPWWDGTNLLPPAALGIGPVFAAGALRIVGAARTLPEESLMVRVVGRHWLAAAVAILLGATACNDSESPEPDAALLPLPDLATLAVTVASSGSDVDPDGYTVTVDGSSSQSVGANGLVTFTGLAAGDHTVGISGVASNCTVSGDNPRTVSLIVGVVGTTSFSVSCAAIPKTGDLTVTTSTTGSSLDPDGYTVTVDGNTSKAIGTNGSVTFTGLSAGDHNVALSGISSNCSVSGGNSRTVTVPAGGTASTTFAVSCAATTGSLTVTTSTTGSNLDPDGYTVVVDGSQSQAIGINTSVTFSGLSPGNHSVQLNGLAQNCTVSSNPRTVSITAGTTTTTTFSVSCTATTTGTLSVTTATTGQNQPTGYTLNVTGPSFPTGASQPIGVNDTKTVTGIAAGDYQVSLSGAPSNCAVSGANPRTVTVTAGNTASTTFSVSCTAATGTLAVTTATTGQNQPTGFTLNVTGPSFPTGTSAPIGANATVTATVTSGDYQVSLSDVPSNCTVSGANPRTVTVPAGGTGPTTFSVSCSAQSGTGEVIGKGQVGTGSPTPGNNVQTFDFDVRADLTGRFTGTDYSDLHPGGVPATLTTDQSTDPATSITAYRSSSTACSDTSRGVEFDAIGREDTGGLVNYTVAACDNGPAGSGMDFWSVFIPSENFGRSGNVTSGDIVKR